MCVQARFYLEVNNTIFLLITANMENLNTVFAGFKRWLYVHKKPKFYLLFNCEIIRDTEKHIHKYKEKTTRVCT